MPDNHTQPTVPEAMAVLARVPRKPTPKPMPPPATHYWMDELQHPDHEGNRFMSICCVCKKAFRGRYAGATEQKAINHIVAAHKILSPRRTWRRPAPKRQRTRKEATS